MPVRSLNSSVLKWPDQTTVDRAARSWAREEATRHPELRGLGYFGSYARDDWGVGSDLDLIAIVAEVSEPFERRALNWHMDELPVPAELAVYSEKEWQHLQKKGGRFARTLESEVLWLYIRQD